MGGLSILFVDPCPRGAVWAGMIRKTNVLEIRVVTSLFMGLVLGAANNKPKSFVCEG
jgi:hypothetical protein